MAALRVLTRFPEHHVFAPVRIPSSSLRKCLRAVIDLADDQPYLGASNTIPQVASEARLTIENARRGMARLVNDGLAFFVEGTGMASVSEEFGVEFDRAARQYERWERDEDVATTVRVKIAGPDVLPPEWKELVNGIADQHGFGARPYWTGTALYVDFETVSDSPDMESAAKRAATELEQALVSESVPALVDASESTPFSIYAIDVGQGDSTLIVGPRQEGGRRTALLIDAGDGGYFGKVRGQR